MRRLILPALTVIVALSTIFTGFQISRFVKNITGRNQTTQWELEKNSTFNLLSLSADNSREESTLKTLFYRQEQKELLTNQDFNRSIQATVICLYGNSSLLFNGSYPLTPDSPTECLISEAAALQLFGDSQVSDGTITWENQTYTIKGILPESEIPLLVVESRLSSDTFSYLYCKQFDSSLGEETMNAYFLSHNIYATQNTMNLHQKNLMSLVTKENTYYEILFLRDLNNILTWSHMLVFLLLLVGILLFTMWWQRNKLL